MMELLRERSLRGAFVFGRGRGWVEAWEEGRVQWGMNLKLFAMRIVLEGRKGGKEWGGTF